MTKRNDPAKRLIVKRQAWLERTRAALQVSEIEALRLLRVDRKQSIRINPLKPSVGKIENTVSELDYLSDSSLERYTWMPEGYYYTRESSPNAIRDSQLHSEGAFFIQNAASWLPVLALDPQAGEIILDVCAAPGGKTSHIAAITSNQAHITANDNSRPRLAKMRANLDRLGVTNVETTLYDAVQLSRKLDGVLFDKILLDAPCSGEGMMQYDNDKSFATWSVAHIKRLEQLQKRLITNAWQLLKPGGTLVYSTCTMAPEENESVIDYLLRTRHDVTIEPLEVALPNRVPAVAIWNNKTYNPKIAQCMRLAPSPFIEAFFVCKLSKTTLM